MPDLDQIKQVEQGCGTGCALRWRRDRPGNIIVFKLSNSHFMLPSYCGPKPPGDRKRALAVGRPDIQRKEENLLQIRCRWPNG